MPASYVRALEVPQILKDEGSLSSGCLSMRLAFTISSAGEDRETSPDRVPRWYVGCLCDRFSPLRHERGVELHHGSPAPDRCDCREGAARRQSLWRRVRPILRAKLGTACCQAVRDVWVAVGDAGGGSSRLERKSSDIIGIDQLTAPELGQQTVHQEVLLVGTAEG